MAELQLSFVQQDLAATQKGQLDQHTKASESLFGSIRVMESKLSEAKSKKETLKVGTSFNCGACEHMCVVQSHHMRTWVLNLDCSRCCCSRSTFTAGPVFNVGKTICTGSCCHARQGEDMSGLTKA